MNLCVRVHLNEHLDKAFVVLLNSKQGAAVAQWIRLAAHGQWVVGSNPIRAIGGVRKGIRPQ